MQTERRYVASPSARIEVRQDGDNKTITGYAAVFFRDGENGTEYNLFDEYFERISRGAFDRALSEQHDVRALFNHNSDMLLGRSKSGTLRLSVDDFGLRYDITLADTQAGRDVATSIDRGDITGSSFAFIPRKVSWIEEDERVIREIGDVDLYDVGPVTYPAYEATSAAMRSADKQSVLQEWERQKPKPNIDSRQVGDRVLQIRLDELHKDG
jgi:HK97 family phage prohead protease